MGRDGAAAFLKAQGLHFILAAILLAAILSFAVRMSGRLRSPAGTGL
jgi:hypothetical protein